MIKPPAFQCRRFYYSGIPNSTIRNLAILRQAIAVLRLRTEKRSTTHPAVVMMDLTRDLQFNIVTRYQRLRIVHSRFRTAQSAIRPGDSRNSSTQFCRRFNSTRSSGGEARKSSSFLAPAAVEVRSIAWMSGDFLRKSMYRSECANETSNCCQRMSAKC